MKDCLAASINLTLTTRDASCVRDFRPGRVGFGGAITSYARRHGNFAKRAYIRNACNNPFTGICAPPSLSDRVFSLLPNSYYRPTSQNFRRVDESRLSRGKLSCSRVQLDAISVKARITRGNVSTPFIRGEYAAPTITRLLFGFSTGRRES